MEVQRIEITKNEFLLGITNLVKKNHKKVRQKSKGQTFKLAYGGYPDADKGGVITQEIFDNYHDVLYPGISKMKDEAMKQAKQQSYLHLGLGCRLKSNDIDKNSRTLFNALSQFWSVLTLITLARVNEQIKLCGYEDDIKITATIYDSIYFIIRKDASIVKWLNDTIIPIMTEDFLKNQVVKNDADLCVGTRWSNVEDIELDHNASEEEITEILKGL